MGYVVEVGEIETGIWGGLGDVPYILVAHDKAAVFFCFSGAGVKGDDFRMVGFNGIFYTIISDSVTSEVKSFLVFCFEEDAHGIPAGDEGAVEGRNLAESDASCCYAFF